MEKANPVCKNQNCGLEGQPQDMAGHPLPPGVQLHVNEDGSCYVTTEVELSPTTREILGALKDAGAGKWVHVLADRYLGFEKIGLG